MLAAINKLLRCPLMRFFRNPHHLSGTVFAMILANASAIIWSLVVLAQDGSLTRSRYAFVNTYVPENLVAAFFLGVGTFNMAWLALGRAPMCCNVFGYAAIFAAWAFVAFWNIHAGISDAFVYPTATSLSLCMTFASLYAYLDGQLRSRDDAE